MDKYQKHQRNIIIGLFVWYILCLVILYLFPEFIETLRNVSKVISLLAVVGICFYNTQKKKDEKK